MKTTEISDDAMQAELAKSDKHKVKAEEAEQNSDDEAEDQEVEEEETDTEEESEEESDDESEEDEESDDDQEEEPADEEDDEKPIGEELGEDGEEEEDEDESDDSAGSGTEDDDADEDEDEEESETVPLATHLSVKRDLKILKKSLKQGFSEKDLDGIAGKMAKKYQTTPETIKELFSEAFPFLRKKLEADIARPLLEKQEKEAATKKKDALFDKVFDQFLAKNPHLKGTVNKNVVKKLVFDPDNAKKKLSEIVADAYGKAAKKRVKSMDGYRTNASDDKIDFGKASEDQMKLVNKDPKLRKKFGDDLVKRIKW